MNSSSTIQHTGSGKFTDAFRIFFYRWFALIVLLYGLLGFLFYSYLLLTGHGGATTGLPFRELSKETLWVWLLVFAVLHFAVFFGSFLLLFYNKVWGFILFITGMSAILLANAIINREINYISWGILLFFGFFLWKGRKSVI